MNVATALLTSPYEAYVYGWRNILTGKMYIGFRKSSELYDGYKFSSEDEELNADYGYGILHRSILFRGSVSDAITHERKLLKHADARRNNNFYNKSNGGGAGIRDYTTITNEEAKVGIDWINGIDPTYNIDIYNLVDNDLVVSILENVKAGKYQKIEVPVSEIATYKQNQVRLLMIDHNHRKEIADYMIQEPTEARKHISPIIVAVDKYGIRWIIDGNHTSGAVQDAEWATAPVIFLNTSEFNDVQSNIDQFGILANHNPKIKKGNKAEDCQRAVINLYNNNLAKLDDVDFSIFRGEKFKNTCLTAFKGVWTNKTIVANLDKAINRVRTEKAIADLNFQLYSKKELDSIIKPIQEKNPTLAMISVTSGSVYNSGIGGILNKMGGLDSWDGVLVVHHSGITEYENWKVSEEKLKDALKRVHPDCKITYIVLNSFKKQIKIKVNGLQTTTK
jgi:hypothetical protein